MSDVDLKVLKYRLDGLVNEKRVVRSDATPRGQELLNDGIARCLDNIANYEAKLDEERKYLDSLYERRSADSVSELERLDDEIAAVREAMAIADRTSKLAQIRALQEQIAALEGEV